MALSLTEGVADGLAPSAVVLSTERLIMRPPRPDDAEDLFRMVNDWAVVRMLSGLPFPYPRPLMDEWIDGVQRHASEARAYHLVITRKDDGRLVGCAGLRMDTVPGTGRLGYWIGRRDWGQGLATEAAGRVARWALANLALDRITAHVAVDNPASAAVLRRIGFKEAGAGREPFLARGGEIDVVRFAVHREDLFGGLETSGALPAESSPGLPDAAAALAEPAKPLLLVAACALVDADGRVLLARRPEGKPMAGLWEFPGGKVIAGESPETAVIRELREELGIDVAKSCLAAFAFASHDYEGFHLLMPLFLCRRWQGLPEGRERQALAWVRPNRLAEYPMPEADKPLAPLLRDFL